MNQKDLQQAWKDELALSRHEMISPLLDSTLDAQKKQQLRNLQAQKHGVSIRTLQRYEAAYKGSGFAGLKPKSKERAPSPDLPRNFKDLVNEAIILKREVPSRSINQIIMILEMEGHAAIGELKRSTLQHHLYNAGYGKKQMKKYIEAKTGSSGRFVKPHRMMLVQADIKFGPRLPIGKNGKLVQTYLSAAIDDCSRFVVSSGFYDHQEATIVEDTIHKAILKFGKMDSLLVDNGKQYVSKQMVMTCSKLGIRLRRCKPYVAKTKGKIEVFNRFVNSFLDEVKAAKVKTLEELNRHWLIWLDAYYHDKSHSALGEQVTPKMAFNRDSRNLTFLDVNLVAEAFLHHEVRMVDKSGCISFKNRKYEVGLSLIGAKVQISFDPMHHETITISYKGIDSFEAKSLVIGSSCSSTPKIPAHLLPIEPEKSRLLNVLEHKYEKKKIQAANAISFGAYKKEVGSDV